jgi:hypothetical protein
MFFFAVEFKKKKKKHKNGSAFCNVGAKKNSKKNFQERRKVMDLGLVSLARE